MLDETIELFTKRVRETVLADQRMSHIPLAYLITLQIPDSIKHFFKQEVEIWLREEEEKFTSERFDYDEPQVRMLIDQIFDHLQQNAVFELTKFNHLLERAVKLELNYLVRPHRTLTQFIFRNSNNVSTMEVYDTLKYFFKFEYYKNAISDYFNTKYLRSITQDQFVDLINQIDEKAFSENRLETTLKTVKSIMAALAEARQQDVDSISVEVLHDALSDRNLDDYAGLVKEIVDKGQVNELTLGEVEQLLKTGKLEAGVSEETQTTLEPHRDIESEAPEVDVAEIEMKEAEVDLTEVEEEEDEFEEELDEETEAAAEAITDVRKSNVASDLADHVAKQISSTSPLADLNEMIKGRQRRKIIKRLFRKNEQEFLKFLQLINNQPNWKSASHIIDDEFYNREINPYSKEAIALSDVIYLRFFPKDKYVGEKSDDVKFD